MEALSNRSTGAGQHAHNGAPQSPVGASSTAGRRKLKPIAMRSMAHQWRCRRETQGTKRARGPSLTRGARLTNRASRAGASACVTGRAYRVRGPRGTTGWPESPAPARYPVMGLAFQISRAYSAMVRSDEKAPMPATFSSALRPHCSGWRYNASTCSWVAT